MAPFDSVQAEGQLGVRSVLPRRNDSPIETVFRSRIVGRRNRLPYLLFALAQFAEVFCDGVRVSLRDVVVAGAADGASVASGVHFLSKYELHVLFVGERGFDALVEQRIVGEVRRI